MQHHPAPAKLQVSMSRSSQWNGKKKTKNGWFTHHTTALAPLFSVEPQWFLHLGIYLKSVPFLCDGHQKFKALPDWLLQHNQPWSCVLLGPYLLFCFPLFSTHHLRVDSTTQHSDCSWSSMAKGLIVLCIPCLQDTVSDFLAGSFAFQHDIIMFVM